MFTKLTEQLKANPKTIVFTEGTDPRIQDAAAKLTAEGILNVILLGNPDAVKLTAADAKYDISKCEIIDPARYACSFCRLYRQWRRRLRCFHRRERSEFYGSSNKPQPTGSGRRQGAGKAQFYFSR